MTVSSRRRLRELYQFRCGYCGVSETDMGAELTTDHYHPVSQGGSDDFENLVYCCHACNEFKGDFWQAESEERLLHPLHDNVAVHLAENENGTLTGLTQTGRFHIQRLRLNRPPLVAHRHWNLRQDDARRRQAQLDERLRDVESRLVRLEQHFDISEGKEE